LVSVEHLPKGLLLQANMAPRFFQFHFYDFSGEAEISSSPLLMLPVDNTSRHQLPPPAPVECVTSTNFILISKTRASVRAMSPICSNCHGRKCTSEQYVFSSAFTFISPNGTAVSNSQQPLTVSIPFSALHCA